MSATSSIDEWLAWQECCHVKEIDLGLERVATVYTRLNPKKTKPIYSVTVAGTNGKGSSVAMLESILIAAGYRVGVYSTPHLTSYNERIRLNGQPVADGQITESFSRINNAREEVSLSYFEFGTLAALDIFEQQNVDVQLLEVGLGGRLDAVNIIDADAALITTIDIDHIAWLGDDLSSIAREKAGIFRAEQKAVCADKSVPKSLIDYANALKTNLLLAGKDFDVQLNSKSWRLMANHELAGEYPMPALQGQHQIQNAAGVISLLAHITDDIPVNKESINQGLQTVNLAGRLQQVASSPDVYLDVAHNAESALALLEFVKTKEYNELHVVFSILDDKDLDPVIQPFINIVKHWHIAPLKTARAQSTDTIEAYLQHSGSRYTTYESMPLAFKGAINTTQKDDLLVCFGSFYVVEACLDAL